MARSKIHADTANGYQLTIYPHVETDLKWSLTT